jgi:hypothetical protein
MSHVTNMQAVAVSLLANGREMQLDDFVQT